MSEAGGPGIIIHCKWYGYYYDIPITVRDIDITVGNDIIITIR